MGKRKNSKSKNNEKAEKPFRFSDYENGGAEDRPDIQEDLNATPPPSPREEQEAPPRQEAPEPPPSPVDRLTIGAFLKQKREEKGLSIKIISQHTKISVTMLEYLEGDLFEQLPDKAYVKGYIKSYARIVGANQQESLEILDRTYQQFSDVIPKPKNLLEQNTESTPEAPPVALVVIGLMVVVAVGLGVFLMTDKNAEPTQKIAKEVVEEVIEPTTLSANTPLKGHSEGAVEKPAPKAEAVADTDPEPPEEEAPALVEVKKEEPKPVKKSEDEDEDFLAAAAGEEEADKNKEEKKEEEITFRPLTLPLYSIDTSLKEEEINQFYPSNIRNSIIEGQQNLFINAHEGDSWITYKTDQNPIKKFVLKQGRTLLIRGAEIRIFLGNVNATKMFYNGNPIAIKTSSGVKSLVFPEKNHSKFKIPLFVFKKDGTVDTSDNYMANN